MQLCLFVVVFLFLRLRRSFVLFSSLVFLPEFRPSVLPADFCVVVVLVLLWWLLLVVRGEVCGQVVSRRTVRASSVFCGSLRCVVSLPQSLVGLSSAMVVVVE